jgi:hypothetical protein
VEKDQFFKQGRQFIQCSRRARNSPRKSEEQLRFKIVELEGSLEKSVDSAEQTV